MEYIAIKRRGFRDALGEVPPSIAASVGSRGFPRSTLFMPQNRAPHHTHTFHANKLDLVAQDRRLRARSMASAMLPYAPTRGHRLALALLASAIEGGAKPNTAWVLFDNNTDCVLYVSESFNVSQTQTPLRKEERIGTYDTDHRLFNPVETWRTTPDR